MTVEITICKPGYAYGYIPSGGTTDIQEFIKDVSAVSEPTRVLGMMRMSGNYVARDFEDRVLNRGKKFTS